MIALFLPEIAVCAAIAALLGLTLCGDKTAAYLARKTAIAGALLALAGAAASFGARGTAFWGSYSVDGLSQFFKCALAGCALLAATMSGPQLPVAEKKRAEYFVFIFTGTLGMMMLSSAVEALTFYIGLELSAYSLYLLVPMKEVRWNAEAGIKYIVFGAVTSGFLLYGLSILVGLTQATHFAEMAARVPEVASDPAFLVGVFFVSGALFFKLSLFPFHFWAPDTYEAAATAVTAFIATASKAAAVVILLRIFSNLGVPAAIVPVLGVLAFLSMTVGNAAALLQQDVKRLLAYSSVAQAGYILVGLLSGTGEAYSAVFFYAAAYALMNAAAFLVVLKVGEEQGTDNPSFNHFNGLADRSPLLAVLLLVSLLSLAGIPPLIGFTGKWFLFAAAMKQGHWFLVLAGVINSVISLYYYLTVVKHAYLLKSDNTEKFPMGPVLRLACVALFLALILSGVFPKQLLDTAEAAFTAVR